MCFFIFIVFLVKLPILRLHLWLPKAHVESPTFCSMILAGVILKLGGYGLFRFFILLDYLSFSYSFFFDVVFYISLLGSLVSSLICLRQIDLKLIIAYSSIVHIRFAMLGLFRIVFLGEEGFLLIIISHGFISPMLFFILGILYESLKTRTLLFLKGFIILRPSISLFWFLRCFLNLGLPPFMSFFSEIFIISSLSFLHVFDFFVIFLCLFFSGVYCVIIFISVFHGYPSVFDVFFINLKDFFIIFVILYYIILFPVLSFC